MSLNAHDRHALDLIEEGLADSDPRFAAKLSAFSRLTDDGEMPARERIGAGRLHSPGLAVRGLLSGGPARQRRVLYVTAIAVWLSISVMLISVALVLSHSGSATACTEWRGTACAGRATPTAPPVPAGHKHGAPSSWP